MIEEVGADVAEGGSDAVREGARIIAAANAAGVRLRVLGGVAVALHSPNGIPSALARVYEDIDLVTTRTGGAATISLLSSLGYAPNERFNALNGHRRLVAYDRANGRRIDIFVGDFRMCHTIPVAERLDHDTLTVPLAELMATKLQIVELNDKDVKDILALLAEHEVGDLDEDTINASWLADLFAGDWGLWRTATGTLATIRERLGTIGLNEVTQQRVIGRVDALEKKINSAPKSLRWRVRARVGSRAKWYDEPEEIAHGHTGTER
jgi:hypothetical protein